MSSSVQTSVRPWTWVGRAMAVAVVLIIAGWCFGIIGALWRPWLGFALGTLFVLVIGGFGFMRWIGPASLGAGLLGMLALYAMATEGHHAKVARTSSIATLPSLSVWNPRDGAVALYVGELQHLRKLQTWSVARTSVRGKVSSNNEVATPLFDPVEQRVVGFYCRDSPRRQRNDGRWALSTAAWSNTGDGPQCEVGVRDALAKCVTAGLAVAPGASSRLVEVFATEAELRDAYDLPLVLKAPAGGLAVYLLLAAVFRRRGAESA